MRLKLIITLAVAAGYTLVFPQEVKNIDFKTAIELTIQKYPVITKLNKQVEAVDSRVEQLKSSYLPVIEGEAGYTRVGPVSQFEFGDLSAKVNPENNYDAHIKLNYTLYDFGKRDALVDVTASNRNAAIDNVDFTKTNLSYQVVQSFYSVLYLKESLKLKDEQIANLNDHLKITTDKVKAGTATDYDILSTQVKISAAENQKVDILNEINKQEIQLKSLMGLSSDEKINLTGGFGINNYSSDADSLVKEAYSNRSELKISKDNEQTARLQKLNVTKNDVPNLQFIFQYGFRNGFIPNLDAFRGNFAAGINLKYPIYDGNKKDAMIQEADALLQSTQSNTSELELTIRSEILKILSDLSSINQQLQNTKIQIQHAEKSLERSELQYKEGTARNLDLLDAQTNLSEAKFSELQLVFRNIMANYSLQKAVGIKLWQ